MKLDARLAAVAAFVPQGSRVADIGTDHGYLAVALVEHYAQLLFRRRQSLFFFHVVGFVLHIGICRIDNVQTLFPVVIFHNRSLSQ